MFRSSARGILPIIAGAVLMAGCTGGNDAMLDGDQGIVATWEGALLEGFVVDDAFNPIADALVRLVGTSNEARTDSKGWFQFTGLDDGTYRISVEAAGWRGGETTVSAARDRITKITIFLDPELLAKPYSLLTRISGKVTCLVVQGAGQGSAVLSCPPVQRAIGFPQDWAATVTEVTWGEHGFSTQSQAVVVLGFNETIDGSKQWRAYAAKTGSSPLRFVLEPGTSYEQSGGERRTPEEGLAGPLDVHLRKAATRVGGQDLTVGATIDQSFVIYHTTFFHDAPDNLADYTVIPGS